MKTILAIGAAALAGLILSAGLRRSAPETPAAPVKKPTAKARVQASATVADPMRKTAERLALRPEEIDAFVSTARSVVGELRQIQLRRQSEWTVEVDQQTRLEWEERYDADRKAAVERLDRFLDGGEVHRHFRDQIDTWAARISTPYGVPRTQSSTQPLPPY